MERQLNPSRLAVARALAIDTAAAEVIRSFRGDGIDPVLLKGASLAGWLYPGDVRPYGDADLLVAPWDVMHAASVLERLGFRPMAEHVSPHSKPWGRADGAQVDLHARLFGLRCAPDRAWRELQAWVEPLEIASTSVRALSLPARALQVVLHAVQHREQAKPREDLRRALAAGTIETWRGTEQLAGRLEALHILAHGLALEPEGLRLLDRLPLVRAAWLSDQLDAPLAVGLARLREARGSREKLAVLRRELAPPDPDLDALSGDAASTRRPRGRAHHLLLLALRLPKTVRALRRDPPAGAAAYPVSHEPGREGPVARPPESATRSTD